MKLVVFLFFAAFLSPNTGAQELPPNEWQLAVSKKIVIDNIDSSYDLALDTFNRNVAYDDTGESLFFIFLIHYYRKDYDDDINEYIYLLEEAKKKNNLLAISTLYVVYSEPYLVSVVDSKKSHDLRVLFNRLEESGKVKHDIKFIELLDTSKKLLGIY